MYIFPPFLIFIAIIDCAQLLVHVLWIEDNRGATLYYAMSEGSPPSMIYITLVTIIILHTVSVGGLMTGYIMTISCSRADIVPKECQSIGARSGTTSLFRLSSISACSLVSGLLSFRIQVYTCTQIQQDVPIKNFSMQKFLDLTVATLGLRLFAGTNFSRFCK